MNIKAEVDKRVEEVLRKYLTHAEMVQYIRDKQARETGIDFLQGAMPDKEKKCRFCRAVIEDKVRERISEISENWKEREKELQKGNYKLGEEIKRLSKKGLLKRLWRKK